jgi:hypothetical protein
MQNPLTPSHEITVEGVQYALHFELLDWQMAEEIIGEPLWPIFGTPFWESSTKSPLRFAAVMLFVGIRNQLPDSIADNFKAYMKWARKIVTVESFPEYNKQLGEALTDFFLRLTATFSPASLPALKKALAMPATGSITGPPPESISG